MNSIFDFTQIFNPAYPLAALLVLCRMTPVFIAMRAFIPNGVPTLALSIIILSISGTVAAFVDTRYLNSVASINSVFLLVFSELVIGALLGFGVACFAAGIAFAGSLIDAQSGLTLGALYDPQSNSAKSTFSTVLTLITTAIFFALDLHFEVFRLVLYSFKAAPVGAGFPNFSPEVLLVQVGAIFGFGITLVAPLFFTLWLLDLAFAVTSRLLPQLNIIFLGVPVKMIVGLIVFTTIVVDLGPRLVRFWQLVLTQSEQLFL